jgi:hypothetical protein
MLSPQLGGLKAAAVQTAPPPMNIASGEGVDASQGSSAPRRGGETYDGLLLFSPASPN